jgi:hypothetical protein
MTREETKIMRLKKQIFELGPMLPGTISKQWNVCGTPGCKCKDKKKPRKHGPYYQISFTVAGKSSTMFLKKTDRNEARKRIKCYKQFKELNKKLTQTYVELARKNGMERN